jgi:hypothetical protein
LTRWFEVASEAMKLDDSDLPFVETEAELPTIDADEAVRLAEETFGIKAEVKT